MSRPVIARRSSADGSAGDTRSVEKMRRSGGGLGVARSPPARGPPCATPLPPPAPPGPPARRPPMRIPYPAADALGALEECRVRLFGGTPLLTRGAVEIFRHDWSLDSREAIAELGYTQTPLIDGVTRTLSAIRGGAAAVQPAGPRRASRIQRTPASGCTSRRGCSRCCCGC